MSIKQILIIGTLLTMMNSWSQNLTCDDFKTGEFYIPQTSVSKSYTIVSNDSIRKIDKERDKQVQQYIVIRDIKTQTEWKNGINNGNPTYEKIEWIDKCSYRLTYDESKMELDEYENWVNSNKGIIVSKINIENKCMFYDATMTTNEGQTISQKGQICKK
ncbi:hypothetical protein [uncultured Lacinutrix sp.]|uniref:hypothetical protein n=1 Tax=uncultured Lacinutrix sp. TaxID=574032 RepID=UPI002634C546|nr:hypothetical protein [uncultured Lacinutrix sp.]